MQLSESKMIRNSVSHGFRFLDTVFYLTFLSIGFYLNHEGAVVKHFAAKSTSFAEVREKSPELPTMVTFIDSFDRNRYRFGLDFNISLGAEGYQNLHTNLKLGENSIKGSSLKVDVEELYTETSVLRVIGRLVEKGSQ